MAPGLGKNTRLPWRGNIIFCFLGGCHIITCLRWCMQVFGCWPVCFLIHLFNFDFRARRCPQWHVLAATLKRQPCRQCWESSHQLAARVCKCMRICIPQAVWKTWCGKAGLWSPAGHPHHHRLHKLLLLLLHGLHALQEAICNSPHSLVIPHALAIPNASMCKIDVRHHLRKCQTIFRPSLEFCPHHLLNVMFRDFAWDGWRIIALMEDCLVDLRIFRLAFLRAWWQL